MIHVINDENDFMYHFGTDHVKFYILFEFILTNKKSKFINR